VLFYIILSRTVLPWKVFLKLFPVSASLLGEAFMRQLSLEDFGTKFHFYTLLIPFFFNCLVLVEQNLARKINDGRIDKSGKKDMILKSQAEPSDLVVKETNKYWPSIEICSHVEQSRIQI